MPAAVSERQQGDSSPRDQLIRIKLKLNAIESRPNHRQPRHQVVISSTESELWDVDITEINSGFTDTPRSMFSLSSRFVYFIVLLFTVSALLTSLLRRRDNSCPKEN